MHFLIHVVLKLFGCLYETTWSVSLFLNILSKASRKPAVRYTHAYLKGPQILKRMRSKSWLAHRYAHAHYVMACSSVSVHACALCHGALSGSFGPHVVLRRSLNKEPDHLNLKVKGMCVAVVYCKRRNHLALILCCLYFFCFHFYISLR